MRGFTGVSTRHRGLVVVVAALLSACSTGSPPAPASPAQPAAAQTAAQQSSAPEGLARVTMGNIGSLADAGVYTALSQGYFKEQGIDIQLVNFRSAAVMVPSLAKGELDVGGGSPSAGLYNAAAREITIRVVADRGTVHPKGYHVWMIRKDLVGSIKDGKDLKGKSIAVPAKGTTSHAEVLAVLEQAGLTEQDIKLVELGFPEMGAAFSNKGIDLGLVVEPFVLVNQQQGFAEVWKTSDQVFPGHTVSVLLYSPKFISERGDVAERFMVAYLKGVRDYNDAFFKGDAGKKAAVVKALLANTTIKNATDFDKMGMPAMNPNGRVNVDSLAKDQEIFRKAGLVQKPADMTKLVDHRFVDKAVKVLGEYRR